MNVRRFAFSFRYAASGIKHLCKSELNFRIHIMAISCLIVLILCCQLSLLESAIVLLAASIVLVTEAVNTVMERTLDLLHPEKHPEVGMVKDIGAAAVLIASVLSVVVGILIFWLHISALIKSL